MDDIQIILPCGYTTDYKNLQTQSKTIECPVCESHFINVEQCLNIPKNRLCVKSKLMDIEYKKLLENKHICDSIKSDSSFFVDRNFDDIFHKLDLERESIKLKLKCELDKYYNQLIDYVDFFKNLKIQIYEEDCEEVENFFENFDQNELGQSEIESKEKIKNIKYIQNILEKMMNKDEEEIQYFKSEKSINASQVFSKIEFGPNLNFKIIFNFKNAHVYNEAFDLGLGLDFFENNKILCSMSNFSIKLFDKNTGECLNTYSGHTSKVLCIISINKELFASSSADKTIRIWNVETEQCLRILSGHTGFVRRIKVLNNEQLVSVSFDSTIKIWNYENGKCLKTFSVNNKEEIFCIEILDTDTIITCGDNKKLRFWNIVTGTQIKEIYTGKVIMSSLMINNHLIAIGSYESIDIWNLNSGDCVKTFYGHNQFINSLNILPDKNILVSCSLGGEIKFWNCETTDCLKTIKTTQLLGGLLISNEEKTLYTLEDYDWIRVWKIV
ncbi:unnamed protein product [Brachionus calyciflorus]|uniref:Uncharacterized protein n=1 Tax=Brachionus calyciflorus TaxID=104777 RepID=A0A814I276_9BILA|nr:unnamed protein product [Brachionus calyciflorus]